MASQTKPPDDAYALTVMDDSLAPGAWGNVSYAGTGGGRLLIGTKSNEGPILGLQCRTIMALEFPYLVVGPMPEGPATINGRLQVSGRETLDRGVPLHRLEGGTYVAALTDDMAKAFARGSSAVLDLGA
ncbi:MAG: hypothetical protein AAGF56_11955, partial [Pseudomonadota bacterium]